MAAFPERSGLRCHKKAGCRGGMGGVHGVGGQGNQRRAENGNGFEWHRQNSLVMVCRVPVSGFRTRSLFQSGGRGLAPGVVRGAASSGYRCRGSAAGRRRRQSAAGAAFFQATPGYSAALGVPVMILAVEVHRGAGAPPWLPAGSWPTGGCLTRSALAVAALTAPKSREVWSPRLVTS